MEWTKGEIERNIDSDQRGNDLKESGYQMSGSKLEYGISIPMTGNIE